MPSPTSVAALDGGPVGPRPKWGIEATGLVALKLDPGLDAGFAYAAVALDGVVRDVDVHGHVCMSQLLLDPRTGKLPTAFLGQYFSASGASPLATLLSRDDGPKNVVIMRHYFAKNEPFHCGLLLSADVHDSDDDDDDDEGGVTALENSRVCEYNAKAFRTGESAWVQVCKNRPGWSVFDVIVSGGLFHPKLSVARFDNAPRPFVRVIVSSANMGAGRVFNVAWAQDFPVAKTAAATPTRFGADLQRFVYAFATLAGAKANAKLERNLRALNIFRGVDFSGANGRLIYSLPPSVRRAFDKEGHKVGVDLLAEAVREANFLGNEPPCVFVNNVGNTDSAQTLEEADKTWFARVARALGAVNESEVEIIFPSLHNVLEHTCIDGFSSMGYYADADFAAPGLRQAVYCYDEPGRGPMWHDKMYFRFRSTPSASSDAACQQQACLGWMVLGSHNCSNAAWNGKNVELSVMIRTSDAALLAHWKDVFPVRLPAPKYAVSNVSLPSNAYDKWGKDLHLPFTLGNGVAWVDERARAVLDKHKWLLEAQGAFDAALAQHGAAKRARVQL